MCINKMEFNKVFVSVRYRYECKGVSMLTHEQMLILH